MKEEKYKMKFIKEFYEFTEEQRVKMETKQFLEDAFDKVMNSYAISMDFIHNEVDYFPYLLDEDLKKIVGFEEKVQNYVDELNRCLSTTDCKIKDLPYRYNLYDAFVNKTEPIIEKIILK